MHRGTGLVAALLVMVAVCSALVWRQYRVDHVVRPAGYCEQLLDFCVSDRFEQPGAAYHVKAYCVPAGLPWKDCAVAVWNGASYSYGQGGSVKTVCYVEQARLDPKTHVVSVRKVHVALIGACDIVQSNA